MKIPLILALVLSTVLLPLNAGSAKENSSLITPVPGATLQPGDQLEITGRIKVKGSEPLTFIVLETADGRDFELSGAKAEKLRRQFELKMVILIGEVLSAGDDVRPPLVEVSSYKAAEGN